MHLLASVGVASKAVFMVGVVLGVGSGSTVTASVETVPDFGNTSIVMTGSGGTLAP